MSEWRVGDLDEKIAEALAPLRPQLKALVAAKHENRRHGGIEAAPSQP